MRKEESELRSLFTKEIRAQRYICQPIESPLTGDGIPDAYIVIKEAIGWLEFKVMKDKSPYTNKIPFRPGQYSWLYLNARAGAFSGICIETTTEYIFARVSSVDENRRLIKRPENLIIKNISQEILTIINWFGSDI